MSGKSNNTRLLSTKVQTSGSIQLVGFTAAMAIVALVFLGVIQFAPGNKPRSMLTLIPWLWVGAGLFSVIAAVVWVRSRKPMSLCLESELLLTVGQDSWHGPFTCESGYFTQRIKGIPMRHLVLHIYDKDDRHIVGFTEVWGAIHGKPQGWEERAVPVRGPAGRVWSAAHGRFLCDMREHINERSHLVNN